MNKYPKHLARALILDEMADLQLYIKLEKFAANNTRDILRQLIPVEQNHLAFWKKFFESDINKLNAGRKIKIATLVLFCRITGNAGIHIVLEAIEIYGIRKYLRVWEAYRDESLGSAVRGVLEDEFHHEGEIVTNTLSRGFKPQRIRDIFLGFNDGLVEILGAVSGFFAAFQNVTTVLIAGITVAVAGSISMAASAYAAVSSEREVEHTEARRKSFLENKPEDKLTAHPIRSSFVVGISYIAGASIPLIPILFGYQNILYSIISSVIMILIVSYLIAILSGMQISRRILTNLVIIAFAVSVTYAIGTVANSYLGISV